MPDSVVLYEGVGEQDFTVTCHVVFLDTIISLAQLDYNDKSDETDSDVCGC